MPQKKPKNDPKKQAEASISPEEDTLIQQQLATYRQLATALYNSSDTLEAEAALTPITSLSESSQIVLLLALSREKTTEAADVLLAVNTLAPSKEIRKEARRSLIRLEATRNYPQWTPPPPPVLAEEEAPTNPPRFWKGLLTDTKATGEVQLMLFWEQGDNYKEVRTLGFLLEFFHDGVKDFFTEIGSKRQVENRVERTRSQFGSITLVSCTSTEGKHLLEDALKINQQEGTKPHPDYLRNITLVNNLLLNATDGGPTENISEQLLRLEEVKNLFDQVMDLELDPEETVAGFLDTWLRGDYATAYTALATNSSLREGLTAEEWVARRIAWAEQAHPTQGKSEIAYRNEDDDDADFEDEDDDDDEEIVPPLLLEPEISETSPEVEVFWSLVLTDTETGSTLKELPQATIIYKATGRHWFWTKYTLTREENKWRILTMVDAGTQAFSLPKEELQTQISELAEFAAEQLTLAGINGEDLDEEDLDEDEDEQLEDLDEDEDEDEDLEDDEDEDDEDDLIERFEEVMWITTRAMHYVDALLTQTPEDSTLYDAVYDQATTIQENERAAAYMEMQAERLPELRGDALRKLAMAQLNIASTHEENNDEEQAQKFITAAEKTLRDSLDSENVPMGNILLAQTLIAQDKKLDEAEKLLQQVVAQSEASPPEVTLAEAGLGTIAQSHGEFEQALKHYQRAADISPTLPGIWFNMGMIQRHLGLTEEAEESYQRSIVETPTETGAYVDLAGIYTDNDQIERAEELLGEGMEINPDAADLLAAMALLYINKNDLRHAKEYLDEAIDIDQELEIVQVVQQYYDAARQAQKKQEKPKGKVRKFKKK